MAGKMGTNKGAVTFRRHRVCPFQSARSYSEHADDNNSQPYGCRRPSVWLGFAEQQKRNESKPNKGTPRSLHEYPYLQDHSSIRPDVYGHVAQSHFHDSAIDGPNARNSPFASGNEQLPRVHGGHGRARLLSQQERQAVAFASPGDDGLPQRDAFINGRMSTQYSEPAFIAPESSNVLSDGQINDTMLRMEGKHKVYFMTAFVYVSSTKDDSNCCLLQGEDVRMAKEVEAHEARIRKEMEKQDILRRKNEERIRREMERQDRERRKEEERLMRERQREEERSKEQKCENERREKFLQKENIRVFGLLVMELAAFAAEVMIYHLYVRAVLVFHYFFFSKTVMWHCSMPPCRAPRQNHPGGDDEEAQSGFMNAMEDFFQRFSTSMVLEINYDRAYKNGARAFSHVVEPLDAHNWVETIKKMFIQVRCPEDRKVGLATQFLEKEAWHWWLDMSRGMGEAANHILRPRSWQLAVFVILVVIARVHQGN
ncbi:PREDICTED: uncharacterized protein LOC101306520 [Fragaria vesca subsp. vesca]